jgi:predicted acylesterase/phospholipase RssA
MKTSGEIRAAVSAAGATASAAPGGAGDGLPDSELRLAVAFTGGVSLAVWMGGMAREMNLLLAASRAERGEQVKPPCSPESQRVRDGYQCLLHLLNMDCTLDILSGTSAGGVNAAILGLANVQRLDLGGLRDLWFTHGSLDVLLRDPSDKSGQQPASVLDGDKGLLAGLRKGFQELSRGGLPPAPSDPTEVFITTTLLSGEACRLTDEYGTLIHDIDHHGLFRFTSDQLADNVPALAFAARCSASFPAAFEPALIPIGEPDGNDHPDMAPFATNISTTQFAADGGLLANRPIGPALQAVFDRPADHDVRRVFAYVVPTVAEPPIGKPAAGDAVLPGTLALAPALLTDLKAMMSQSISTELAAITAHNDQVRARRDARQELARLGGSIEQLTQTLYQTYRDRRADHIARAAVTPVRAQLDAAKLASDGRPRGFGDADVVIEAARQAVLDKLPPQPPDDDAGIMAAGREALDDAKATVFLLLNEAYHMVSSAEDRQRLGELKQQAGNAMPRRVAPGANAAVALGPSPAQDAAAAAAAQALLGADMEVSPGHDRPWQELGQVVCDLHDLLRPGGGQNDFVRDLLSYLTASSEPSAETVASRLFHLHITRYVLQPDGLVADQKLEFIQMSADTRTILDTRTLASQKLTGLQMHHFGAFYKCSWRANDWMWGRLDGAGWLVHMLLDPRRLHLLAKQDTDFPERLKSGLRDIASEDPPPGVWESFPPQGGTAAMPAELAFLTDGSAPTPTSLPTTAMWVAGGLQRHIAAEELVHVAEKAEEDAKNGYKRGAAQTFISAYRNTVSSGGNDLRPVVPADRAKDLLQACNVSAERLEQEVGTAKFTQTMTKAAAVTVMTVDQGRAARSSLRPLLSGTRTATMLAYRAARVGPVARFPVLAGLAVLAAGALASTSTLSAVSTLGLGLVLAGMVLVAAGAARRISLVVATIALVAGVALAAGGVIPAVRERLFPWLKNDAVPFLAQHPVLWAIVVLFLLLPPVFTVAGFLKPVLHLTRRRIPPSKVAPTPGKRFIHRGMRPFRNWRQNRAWPRPGRAAALRDMGRFEA